jgi:integrase
LQAGARWNESILVFTTGVGAPLNRHNVTREFKALSKQSRLLGQRFHYLRHTTSTLLLAQNVSIRTVVEVLGHIQISLTANDHAHVLDPAKRNAVERVNTV